MHVLLRRSPSSSVGRSNGAGRAVAWAASGRLFGRLIDLATLVLLARSLQPADFGVVAMAMAIILLIESATQMPLIQPILRAETPLAHHYDMAFTLGFARAVGIAAVVVLSAPLVASFYGEPRLLLLLGFLALAPAARGLMSPRLADRVRAYDMRHEFVMAVGGKLVALAAVALTLIMDGGYWAMATGTVATPIVMCVASYWFAPYRPRLSFSAWADFADIIGWSSLNQLLRALNFQTDRLVLGRIVSPTELGRYSLATDLSALPIQAFVQSLDTTMVTTFARAREQGREDRLWLIGLNGMFAVLGPIFLSLAVLASPVVQIALGDGWLDVAPFLTLLALLSIVGLPNWMLPPLSVVLHRADLPTKRTMTVVAVRLPATIIGAILAGPFGAIAGRGLGTVTETVLSIRGARTLTGLGVGTQLWSLRRTAVGLVAFVAVMAAVAPSVPLELHGSMARLVLIGQAIAAIAAGLAAMVASMLTLWLVEARPPGLEDRLAHALYSRGV